MYIRDCLRFIERALSCCIAGALRFRVLAFDLFLIDFNLCSPRLVFIYFGHHGAILLPQKPCHLTTILAGNLLYLMYGGDNSLAPSHVLGLQNPVDDSNVPAWLERVSGCAPARGMAGSYVHKLLRKNISYFGLNSCLPTYMQEVTLSNAQSDLLIKHASIYSTSEKFLYHHHLTIYYHHYRGIRGD